jgi:hypothetical protein
MSPVEDTPLKDVFDLEAKSVRRLQLCNSEKYPIFFADLLYDPRLGHNDDYLFRLVGDVFKANGYNAFAIVDSLDNVIVEVRAKGARSPDFALEEYRQ